MHDSKIKISISAARFQMLRCLSDRIFSYRSKQQCFEEGVQQYNIHTSTFKWVKSKKILEDNMKHDHKVQDNPCYMKSSVTMRYCRRMNTRGGDQLLQETAEIAPHAIMPMMFHTLHMPFHSMSNLMAFISPATSLIPKENQDSWLNFTESHNKFELSVQ